MMLCFRWQGGAVSLPPRQAHFLHRPLQYINPQRRTSPEALTKFAKRKNSSPAALPLSPTHYWGFRGDTSLARKAQGTAAQEKVRPKIVCKGMSLEFLPCIAKHMRFEDCFVGTVMCAQLKVCLFAFFFQISPRRGIFCLQFPKTKHETSVICRRPNTPLHILQSKCIGNEYSYCVQVLASRQFHQSWRSVQLWNRHHGYF